MASKKVEARIGRQTLSLESGKVAKQADGAVLVRYGDTVVLVAAVSAKPQMRDWISSRCAWITAR